MQSELFLVLSVFGFAMGFIAGRVWPRRDEFLSGYRLGWRAGLAHHSTIKPQHEQT